MHPSEELKSRTKKFAIRIMRVMKSLVVKRDMRPIADQLLRSGTSVAAKLIGESGEMREEKLAGVLDEARQLVKIFSAAKRTTQNRLRIEKSKMKNEK